MSTWAVIQTGGKQYKVAEGDSVDVEKISEKEGKVILDKVLLAQKDKKVRIGKPFIDKAKVNVTVIGNKKDKKVRVVKFKSKSRYLRTTGHRQQKSTIKIEKISL